MVSRMSSETSASGPSWPDKASRNVLARPRVRCCSSPVARNDGHMTAGVARAAGAVVVAHLDRAGEPAPFRPVERGGERQRPVVGLEAEQAAVVHLRGPDDLAGVEQALRVEGVLDLLEGADHAPAEHRLVELGAHQPVAVLARMRALVFADHRERLLGDRPHLSDFELLLDVEHRAHMQAADRGVRVPGAVGAVLFEDPGQPLGVVGKVFERAPRSLRETRSACRRPSSTS